MKAFGMELQRDYASRIETYTNESESCQSVVSLTCVGEAWVCHAHTLGHTLAIGHGATADEAAAVCEADARRNHAALSELLERTKS